MNDRDVLLIGGVRTPIGKFGGVLKDLSAVELGAVAVRGALERTGAPAAQFDQGFVGHARQAGNGPNPGRLVAIKGGLPTNCPVCTIQQACVSSIQALMLGGQAIRLGEADLVMVAGAEHMSSIPFLSMDTRWGARMGDAKLLDAMYKDGFIDPMTGKHMGELTEAMAEERGITRQAQDEFALLSQKRAEEARVSGFTARTTVPVEIRQRKGTVLIQNDEHPRADSTLEKLAALPGAFKSGGTVTAGNASGITDGAVALVLASRAKARELGLTGVAQLKSGAVAAVEPKDFALAPVPAVHKALQRAGVSLKDTGAVEINEAFAAMVIAVMKDLDLGMDKVNLYGGAIAYGHPVGISGARVVLSLMEIMREKGISLGLATICGNGGNGGAVVLELEQ